MLTSHFRPKMRSCSDILNHTERMATTTNVCMKSKKVPYTLTIQIINLIFGILEQERMQSIKKVLQFHTNNKLLLSQVLQYLSCY